jgi:hypothetical protein
VRVFKTKQRGFLKLQRNNENFQHGGRKVKKNQSCHPLFTLEFGPVGNAIASKNKILIVPSLKLWISPKQTLNL